MVDMSVTEVAERAKRLAGLRGVRPWNRHSLVLLVAGLVYLGIGFAYMIAGPSASREVTMAFQLSWMPLQAWGAVFALVGLASIISSRWPPASETWGYTAMTAISGGWAAFYLLGIPFFGAPIQNLTSVLVWSLVAFLWWAVSGLVSPINQRHPLIVVTVDTLGNQVDVHTYDFQRGEDPFHISRDGVTLTEEES